MAFPGPDGLAITARSPGVLLPRPPVRPRPGAWPAQLGLLGAYPGQIDAGADVQLAEDLAEVERDGVRAQEHLGGDLLVGQALGDQVRNGALGVGEARPARFRALGVGEMPPPDSDSPQPAADPPAVAQGRRLVVAGQRALEPPPARLEVSPPA